MEITQQALNTSRGVESTRPSSVNLSNKKTSATDNVAAEEEQTPAQKRQEQQYQQKVDREIQQLQARDREVRAHEAAHVAAGGQYVTGGPSFTYQRGPNGRFYAIGGEVELDVSAIPSDPKATLNKAEVIQRAALAPAQPSSQDQRVAANAAQLAARARLDIAIQQREQLQPEGNRASDASSKSGEEQQLIAESSQASESVSISASVYQSASLAEPARDVFDIVA